MSCTIYKNANLDGKKITSFAVDNGKFTEFGDDLEQKYKDARIVDLKEHVTIAPFADAHIHLDYVYTANLPTKETASGTLFEAIDNWSGAKDRLNADEIKKRALIAIKQQISHGVQYVRTHVDVTEPKFTALRVMLELKEQLKDYMDIQIVAFPQEGYYAYKGGDVLVEEALKMGADVVGGIPHFEYTREDGVKSVHKGFELAMKYDRLLDFHCDETDDEQSRFSEVIAALTYFNGLNGRTAASHTCAMGSYNNAYAFKMMSKYKKADLNFIVCPTENCYLQGRYDSYPKRRGLSRVDELTQSGLNVSFAQDSISDPWYPLGNGNLMHQLDFGLHLSHMMSVENINDSLKFVTSNGAKTMCIEDYGFKAGNSANFVVLNDTNVFDAVRNTSSTILSVRNGKTIMEKQVEKVITEYGF
ncbi:MAG: cytosine deaminase [Succinivibrio sp.]